MKTSEVNQKIYHLEIKTKRGRDLYIDFQVNKFEAYKNLSCHATMVRWVYYFEKETKNVLFNDCEVRISGKDVWENLVTTQTAVEGIAKLQQSFIKLLNDFDDDLEESDKKSWYETVYNP